MLASRSDLARQAMDKALEVRVDNSLGMNGPICIYDLCRRLGVKVNFLDVSMEGFYSGGEEPIILLSALRPLARRVFTAGHELGHHVFGHGTCVDQMIQDAEDGSDEGQEFLVNSFSGYLLMPPLAVKRAYAQRGWDAGSPTAAQMLVVASSFGVGYETLASHMAFSLRLITPAAAAALKKVSLPAIRKTLLDLRIQSHERLLVADQHYALPTLDAEVGTQILLPGDATPETDVLSGVSDYRAGRLFVATKPGLVRVEAQGGRWAVIVRVSRYQYVGSSDNRHLEEVDDE